MVRRPRTRLRIFTKPEFKTFGKKELRLFSISKSRKLAEAKRKRIGTRLEISRIIKSRRGFKLFGRIK